MAQATARLKEAAKLGFARAFVPEAVRSEAGDAGMALTGVGPLVDIVGQIAPKGADRRPTHSAGKE